MNLFVVGWNLPSPVVSALMANLRRLTAVYPQIDEATLWQTAPHPNVFAACMGTGQSAAAPRRYVAESAGHLGFYDGCLIDREGRFEAHDAGALLAHWDELAGRLEGQFAAFRLAKDEPAIDMITDPLGMEQVYYLEDGTSCIVSNHVELIASSVDAGGLDFRGASQLLTMGWVGGDRTLRERVRAVPAAQIWRWRSGNPFAEKRLHFQRSERLRRRHRLGRGGAGRAAISKLADELSSHFRILDRAYGGLRCALTGGRDSRVVAALLRHGGVPAEYYTSGVPGSLDIEIAVQLATRLGVPHEVELMSDAEVVAGWETGATRLIRQNDGMVNFIQVADLIRQPQLIHRLKLIVWGIGGAMCRGHLSDPRFLIQPWTWGSMKSFLGQELADNQGGLFRREAVEEGRAFVSQFVDEAAAEGFAAIDAPDLLFTCDRMRRWGGANGRKAMPAGDRFSPYCTRAFAEATFALSAAQRYCEPLHYGLIRWLADDLNRIACDKGPWRSQWPIANTADWLVKGMTRRASRLIGFGRRGGDGSRPHAAAQPSPRFSTFNHAAWLEAKREWWRDLCLDQSGNPIWSLIDRTIFERLAAPSTTQSERRRWTKGLYNLITLFSYEAERSGSVSARHDAAGQAQSPVNA